MNIKTNQIIIWGSREHQCCLQGVNKLRPDKFFRLVFFPTLFSMLKHNRDLFLRDRLHVLGLSF